jgi:hypothetical protein
MPTRSAVWRLSLSTRCLCCVSNGLSVRAVEVKQGRSNLAAGGRLSSLSNRCFPTKAIRGWLETDDEGRCAIVLDYLRRVGAFDEAHPEPSYACRPSIEGDPLYSVTTRWGEGTLSMRPRGASAEIRPIVSLYRAEAGATGRPVEPHDGRGGPGWHHPTASCGWTTTA